MSQQPSNLRPDKRWPEHRRYNESRVVRHLLMHQNMRNRDLAEALGLTLGQVKWLKRKHGIPSLNPPGQRPRDWTPPRFDPIDTDEL
jgi:hypothetical protein